MGFENRDYYRDGSYTSRLTGFGLDFTPMVKYLIVANVIVFLLQIFSVEKTSREIPEAVQREIDRQQAEAEKEAAEAKKAPAKTPGGKETRAEREKREKQDEVIRERRRIMEEMMDQLPGRRVSAVQRWFELDPEKTVKRGQVWRLLTCAFCHDRYSVWHILFNMLLLYWFGTRLESMYGSREFLLFYLAAALSSSVAYVALAFQTGSMTPAIGASGAVMGVMMLYTIFYPYETIYLFWILPVPLWILLSLYVIYDLHPVLLALAGEHFFTGVAHAGHLGGLAFGFLYWKLGLRLEAPLDREGRPRRIPDKKTSAIREPVILAHPQRDEFFNAELDDVLRKISEQGQGSLTDAERAILLRASEKYRGGR